MKPEASSERRSEPRVETDEAVRVVLRSGKNFEHGTLVDINNKGAFIATSVTFTEGEIVTLEIEMPGSGPTRALQGVIARWQEGGELPMGVGVEFVTRNVDERDYTYNTVKTLLALDLLGAPPKKKRSPTDTIAFGEPYRPER